MITSRSQSNNRDSIRDISDGSNFDEADRRLMKIRIQNISLIIFINGLVYSKSPNLHSCPVVSTIAELPEHLEDLFVTVISAKVDGKKPDINILLEPICQKLRGSFVNGIEETRHDEQIEHQSRIIAPLFMVNTPAKSELMNRAHFASEFPCFLRGI
ncbi:hypothetical protein QAD02_005423 [Eretmocerus hayati]|uniref:Uncharacterized protein n=1 Tax=Eretmocerus hayati TaxID=131215 RepID=A0ACC2NTJ9_9HYME|nr:hypothetical protein QAD02_005423 [Eretmocerus hayati]